MVSTYNAQAGAGYQPTEMRTTSNPYGSGVGPLTYTEKPEDVEARVAGSASGELSRLQREAQNRLAEAQQRLQAEIAQAQFQAQEQIGAKRMEVEALRQQRAQELATLELQFSTEFERLMATGRTHPRVNPRTQPLPLPGS